MAKPNVLADGSAKKTATPRPIKTDDREVDGLARDTSNAVDDIDARLAEIEVSPNAALRAPDASTELWWLCGDSPSATILVSTGAQQCPLTKAATAVVDNVGLVNERALRLYGADVTRYARGPVGVGTLGPVVTVGAWVRLSSMGFNDSIIVSYINGGANATVILRVSAAGIPSFQVESVAGVRSVATNSDVRLSNGTWHYIGGSYDGKVITVSVDGIASSSSAFAYSPLNWAIPGPAAWNIGFPVATGMTGVVQDVRIESVCRSPFWFREYWQRVFGLVNSSNPYPY